jgi:hypothetical protein
MKRCIAVLLVFLAACAHTDVRVNAGSAAVTRSTSATTTTQGGLQVSAQGGRGLALLLGVGVAAAAIVDYARYGWSSRPDAYPYLWNADGNRPAPPLAPERRVNEQDCSRPIEDLSANLKCR